MNKEEYGRMHEVENRHWWYTATHDLILNVIRKEALSKGHMKILDAGCGTGRLCGLMTDLGDVEGIDLSEVAVELCRKDGLCKVRQGDLNTVELGKMKYDVITSIDVIYHRSVKDDTDAVKKMANALKPGGLLILQVPAFEFLKSSHDLAVHTARRYTRKKVSSLIELAGLVREMMTYRVSFFFLPIAAYRLIKKREASRSEETHSRSDLFIPPGPLNGFLEMLQIVENRFIHNCSIPFGLSVFVTARRPSRSGSGEVIF